MGHLFTVNCIEKTKIKKKTPGMAHFKKKFLSQVFDNVFRLLSKELLFPFSAHQGPIL